MKVVACNEESAHIVVLNSCACQVKMKAPLTRPSPRAHTVSLFVAYDKRVKVRVFKKWFCYVFSTVGLLRFVGFYI